MRHLANFVLLCVLIAGCSQSPAPYLEVWHEQRAARKEVVDILATVVDDQTLAEAKTELHTRAPRFEKIAEKARALPAPSEEVRRRLADEEFLFRSAANRLQDEVARVRALKLKGGPEFFRHFESQHGSLLLTVQP